MKKLLLPVLVLFAFGMCYAQTFEEYKKQQRAEYKQYKSEEDNCLLICTN